ncbi:MAG: hypothetical protein HY360_14300 [Verrucomicrobia bacterium]|nr:hypothetical protein [Verrucomicrobiota bacterium]
MDDWKPDDPSLTEYDFNACTVKEFCEAFGLDPFIARGLQEYREELRFVFNLEKLLKLKGMTEELLEGWQNPKPVTGCNTPLQGALGLQTQTAEPLPKLLEAICKKTGASGCLMAAKGGDILFQSGDSVLDPAARFDAVAAEIPRFLRPFHDGKFQMNLANTDVHVIGFESHDLLLLLASGFYVAAMQPKGCLNAETLGFWRSFADEVRRRHPPKIFVETHAKAGEDEIKFNCPKCALGIVVGREYAGASFECPTCHSEITVPDESGGAPASPPAEGDQSAAI